MTTGTHYEQSEISPEMPKQIESAQVGETVVEKDDINASRGENR